MNVNITSYLILSPALSQSIAIALYLKKNVPTAKIYGGVLTDISISSRQYPFDDLIKIDKFENIYSYDVVIPSGSDCTFWMIQHFKNIKVGKIFFAGQNLSCNDKNWTYNIAKTLDIHVPKTWNSFAEIPAITENIFYKPKKEGHGGPRRFCKNKKAIPKLARSNEFLFQEYIPGRSVYAFGFLAKNGNVLVSSQHQELASAPRDGGSAVAVKVVKKKRISELATKILKEVDYTGWGLIEFKYCPKCEDFVLLEINAKFWASIEFMLRNEPKFGNYLFGVESESEKLTGLFWPQRFLTTLNGNLLLGLCFMKKYPKSWAQNYPKLRSVFAGIAPQRLVDLLRKRHSSCKKN